MSALIFVVAGSLIVVLYFAAKAARASENDLTEHDIKLLRRIQDKKRLTTEESKLISSIIARAVGDEKASH